MGVAESKCDQIPAEKLADDKEWEIVSLLNCGFLSFRNAEYF